MKRNKSLRQLAKELGVSHSYLSQIKNGKRPASQKVVSKVISSGKQIVQYEVDDNRSSSYNFILLGNSLVVGQRTLDPPA